MPDQQSFREELYKLYLLCCERMGWNPQRGVSAFEKAGNSVSVSRIFRGKRGALNHDTIDRLLDGLYNYDVDKEGNVIRIISLKEKEVWGVRLHGAAFDYEVERIERMLQSSHVDVRAEMGKLKNKQLTGYLEQGHWTFEAIGWTWLARKLLGEKQVIEDRFKDNRYNWICHYYHPYSAPKVYYKVVETVATIRRNSLDLSDFYSHLRKGFYTPLALPTVQDFIIEVVVADFTGDDVCRVFDGWPHRNPSLNLRAKTVGLAFFDAESSDSVVNDGYGTERLQRYVQGHFFTISPCDRVYWIDKLENMPNTHRDTYKGTPRGDLHTPRRFQWDGFTYSPYISANKPNVLTIVRRDKNTGFYINGSLVDTRSIPSPLASRVGIFVNTIIYNIYCEEHEAHKYKSLSLGNWDAPLKPGPKVTRFSLTSLDTSQPIQELTFAAERRSFVVKLLRAFFEE